MAKTAFSKIMDGALMAPHHYMDVQGNDPLAGRLNNLIHQPAMKIGGLVTAAFILAASADGKGKMRENFIEASAGIGIYLAVRKFRPEAKSSVYLNTAPDKATPATNEALMMVFSAVNSVDKKRLALTATLLAGYEAMYFGQQPFVSTYLCMVAADAGAKYWRTRQVKEQEWTATIGLPPQRQEEKVRLPEASFKPA